MTAVTVTEFRSHAAGMLNRVENGETLVVLRHGKAIAEVSPVTKSGSSRVSWRTPALRLITKGVSLSRAVLAERDHENVL